MKKVFFLLLATFFLKSGFAQSITIQASHFSLGPYGPGSFISVPVKKLGCLDSSNTFKLYISDQNGNFSASPTQIGGNSNFFTPFVNGVIPGGLPAGSLYRLKVVSTKPVTQDISPAFIISASPGTSFTTEAVGIPSFNLQNVNDSIFGTCSLNKDLIGNLQVSKTPDASSILLDSNFVVRTSSIIGNQFNFSAALGEYLTVQMRTKNGSGIWSIKTYLVLNSTRNLSLQTSGATDVCLPDSVGLVFTVNINGNGGIIYNYPGTLYTINWGDGVVERFTHCQLLALAGTINHAYNETSCGQAPINTNPGTIYNAYKTSINAKNICNSFVPITTYTKIWTKPQARIDASAYGCINTPTSFTMPNSSLGSSAPNNDPNCSAGNVQRQWFVDGVLIPGATGTAISPSFTTLGEHSVQLFIYNDPCSSDTTKKICIEPAPIPAFKMNTDKDSISSCLSATISITNNTNSNPCRSMFFSWKVLDGNSNPAPASSYTISNDVVATPIISITTPGKYYIQLNVSNSCGLVSIKKPVLILNSADVAVPNAVKYCETNRSINFETDPAHMPKYKEPDHTGDTYKWVVLGGPYSFVNGTTDASRYPQILFTGYGTYTVTLTYETECGLKTVAQDITFNQPVTANVGANETICFNDPSIAVSASSTGPVLTGIWTTSGGGSFLNGTSPNAVYTFGGNDKNALSVNLTYTVSPPAGSVCPSVSSVKVITIRPENKITNNGPLSICSGSPVNYFPAATSASSTFKWISVVTSGSVTGNTSNPVPSSGGIADVLINLSNTTGIVKYTITPVVNGCNGTATTITVMVEPIPIIISTSSANPVTCASATGSISLTGLISTTSYTVSYSKNGGAATTILITSTNAGVVVINNLTAGNYNNISVALAGCPSATVGPIVLADPNPPATPAIGSNSPVCSGATLSLSSSSATPGVSFSWNGPNGFTNTSANPSIPNVSAAASGTYVVVVSINGCTASNNIDVTVNPTPAAPVVVPVPYCEGDVAVPLTAIADPGNSLRWYTAATGGIASGTAPTPVIIAPGSTYYVSQLVPATGCESPRALLAVNVTPIPVIATATPVNPATCNSATGSITLTGLSGNTTYSLAYTKNGVPVTTTLTSSSGGVGTIGSLSAGVYSAITVALNGCSSVAVGPFTLSDPSSPAAPVVTRNSPICSGNTINLTALSATTGVSYTWTGPDNFTSTTQNPTIGNATILATGTYTVTVSLNNCTASGSVAVLVSPTPAAPAVSTPLVFCQGATPDLLTDHATALNGNTLLWYSAATGGVGNPVAPAISTAVIGSTSYYVSQVVTVTGCESARSLIIVEIKTTSVITASSSTNPTNCGTATGSIRLDGLSATATYSVSYLKNGSPVTSSIASDATGTIIIASLGAGTYTNVNVTLAGCPSNMAGPFVLADPNPPATPTAGTNSPICSGTQLDLTANTTTGGAITYSWTGPNGFASTTQNPSINNVTVAAAGTYSVTATLDNCTSAAGTVLVDIVPVPLAPTVSSPVNYCIGSVSSPLTAAAAPGNSLNWYASASGGLPSSAPTPSTAVAGTTDYFVSQVTPLGCEGPRAMLSVIVNPDAVAQFNYTTDLNCAPFAINASVIQPVLYPDRNSIYEWYVNGTLIGTGTTFPGYTIPAPATTVTIRLRVISSHGCNESIFEHDFATLVVPQPTFTISDAVGCGPLTVQFTNTTPNANQLNLLWDFGNGQTSTAENPGPVVYLPNPSFNDTTYTVTLSAVTICNDIKMTRTILVKSAPKAVFSPDKTFGCSPMTVAFANASLGTVSTYAWDFGDGSPVITSASGAPVQHTYNTGSLTTFHAKLTVVNDCGSSTMDYAIVVSPNPIKLDLVINGTELFGCSPHSVQFFNNSSGATSFFWDFGDQNTLSTTNNIDVVLHTFNTAGVYQVKLRATNGCADTTAFRTITVYPTPTASFTANSTICVGEQFTVSNTSANATSYVWDFGDGTTSVLTNPTHVYATPGTYIVKLMATRLNDPATTCTGIMQQTVTVVASTTGSFTASDLASPCAPLTVTFTNQNLPSVSTTWDFGDGTTGTGDVVTHRFDFPGTYTVKLTTLVPGGCTYVTTKDIVISGPSGQFVYTGGYVCGGQQVRFEGIASPSTDALTFNFGDGTSITTTDRVVFHTYANPGLYVPSVSFNSASGCQFFVKGIDTVRVDRITGGFTAIQQRSCGSTVVNFQDTSSVFFGKTSVVFDFGDGTTGSGSSLNHTYTISGIYTIIMTVSSNSGCVDITSRQVNIIVNNKPVTSIFNTATGCTRQPAIFTADIQSADAINLIQWTTSNGITGSTNPFQPVFTTAGTYSIRLVTGTINGCFDTTFSTILINPSTAVIASPDLTLCKGGSTSLVANPANLQYSWTPIQGLSCTTCPNPIATPDVTTPYVVQGNNTFGCSTYDTVVITVIQPLSIVTNANKDSICIGQSSNLSATGAASYLWTGPNLSSTSISNPVATPLATTTYMVVGSDGFNCFTDTKFVTVAVGNIPTVNLGPDLVLPTGTIRPMTSVVTNGPIRSWQWSPGTNLNCTTCSVPLATVRNNITYTVKVTTAFGCMATDTISIKAFCENVQAFVPNAFTPDGDGINDILMVRGSGIAQVKSFRIFNRWGEVVFERANFSPNNPAYGWDGRVKGVVGQPDVYVYTVEVICENGTPYTYKGNVSVLK